MHKYILGFLAGLMVIGLASLGIGWQILTHDQRALVELALQKQSLELELSAARPLVTQKVFSIQDKIRFFNNYAPKDERLTGTELSEMAHAVYVYSNKYGWRDADYILAHLWLESEGRVRTVKNGVATPFRGLAGEVGCAQILIGTAQDACREMGLKFPKEHNSQVKFLSNIDNSINIMCYILYRNSSSNSKVLNASWRYNGKKEYFMYIMERYYALKNLSEQQLG